MAIGKSDRTIDVFGMLPPEEVAAAPDFLKRQIIDFACQTIHSEKIKQLINGFGGDGRRLPRIQMKYRRDGATGPPLSPHYAASHARRNLRVVPGYKAGTATYTWTGTTRGTSWLRIFGFHAEGSVIGAFIRDIIGFPMAALTRIRQAITGQWQRLVRSHFAFFKWKIPEPPRQPPAAPAFLPVPPQRRRFPPAAAQPRLL